MNDVNLRARLCSVAVVSVTLGAIGVFPSAAPAAPNLTPGLFKKISTGVALINTYGCAGRLISQGTGFLVGNSVVMTARHVVVGACKVRVSVNGERIWAARWSSWSGGGATRSAADVATLKLKGQSPGAYVFSIRATSPPAGTNLSMVGYPLGNRLSLNQGKIISRGIRDRVPLLAVRMLGAEGASGAPFVDDAGRVVALLQEGYGSTDVLGQRTAGVLVGLDLVRWWGAQAKVDLCRAYPAGGISGCTGLDRGATLTRAEAVRAGQAGLLALADLPDAGWRLQSLRNPSSGGRCADYVTRVGLLFAKYKAFQNTDTGSQFTHGLWIYSSASQAQKAYALTSSSANADCFLSLLQDDIQATLKPTESFDAFNYQRISAPALGEKRSAATVRWKISDTATGKSWIGHMYLCDVLAGHAYHDFQLISFDGTALFPDYTDVLAAAIARTSSVAG